MKNKCIALAGNPNVGKSTLFNNLTGMKQHTGNWPGKTVETKSGKKNTLKYNYTFTDIPGTYSLLPHSPEEEVARDLLCFEKNDGVIIVCDITVLERNLNLALQIRELIPKCIICLNLADEARKKHIEANEKKLSDILKAPVVTTAARNKEGISKLLKTLDEIWDNEYGDFKISYDNHTENYIKTLESFIDLPDDFFPSKRWISIKLLQNDTSVTDFIKRKTGKNILTKEISEFLKTLPSDLSEKISSSVVLLSENITNQVVIKKEDAGIRDRKLDKILTGPLFGIPAMILLTAVVFYITIAGANYPSALLSEFFTFLEDKIYIFLSRLNLPPQIVSMLVSGVYRVLSWVISVMLPPMAIFFPLFALLEDSGYLPRIAFNLDKPFKKCNACGKQALTMCMGFGCNACGVTGCRIIDSPRERYLAILTNSLVPCNGRFPALIALITMFFIKSSDGSDTLISSLILTGFILLSVFATFSLTKLLSKTLLKGKPSSFTLELPSYRKPQTVKVIARSMYDKTLKVLCRAVCVAAPAGLIIWLFANITIGESSLIDICASFLNPLGEIMGLDGIILMAFILGFPANEIVLPLIIMGYLSCKSPEPISSLTEIKRILIANNWDLTTAFSSLIFMLFHCPCSTTLLTIKKETGSMKMTLLAAVIPTLTGTLVCIFFNLLSSLLY